MSQTELKHFGVLGMKWGVRKANRYSNRNVVKTNKQDYKTAKKQLHKDTYKLIGTNLITLPGRMTGYSIKGAAKQKKAKDTYDKSKLQYIDKKAKYKASKKADKKSAEKAEFKTYVNEMRKNGLPNEYYDKTHGNESSRLYEHLTKKKGKEYSDRVVKTTRSTLIKDGAIAVAVSTGALLVTAYMSPYTTEKISDYTMKKLSDRNR